MFATFDVASMGTHGGKVLWPLPGPPPRLTPLSVEVAACDADLQAIAFDGGMPVAAGKPQATVPAKTRAAVIARDKGCRFPGCSAPVRWTDAHHARWRSEGGTNAVDNLLLLCRRCHRRVHTQRWSITLRADGTAEFRMRGRRWISAPRE